MTLPVHPSPFEVPGAIRDVIESVPSGVVMVDAGGVIVHVNQEIERMFGYAREALLGRPIEMLLAERFRSAYVWRRSRFIDSPRRRTSGALHDVFARRSDGTEFPIEMADFGLRPEFWDGKILALATVTDHSELQSIALELEQATANLKRLSLFDALTGLPNRTLLFDRLEQALTASKRSHAGFGVMMMDLNLFKSINDSMGHAAGDSALAEVGRRLHQITRATDTFARIGGDEFAGLLVGCETAVCALVIADKIHAAFADPVIIGGTGVPVSTSIGVALYPEHGTDSRTLLAHADQAMYVAKRSSRSCEIYTEEGAETRPFLIACDLPQAIEHRELFLVYQPKVHLASGALAGVEVLVRWLHPRLGLVSPDEFISVAERTSLIKPMTYAILEMALEQAARWRDEGTVVPVSVNLSARMVDDAELTARTAASLERRRLGAGILTYEVTETSLMASPKRAQKSLRALHDAGVGISIDDFGAGYTSLRHLRDLVISEIKIDKIFITGLDSGGRDVEIVRSIATLSRGFDVKLVAEGIEDAAQCDLLLQLGCDYGQGYALGRPMSAEQFGGWRAERPRPPPSDSLLRA